MSTQLKIPIEPENAQAHSAHEKYVTFEEFLALDAERGWSEWIDGKVIFMSAAAASRHQLIVLFLLQTLGLYVKMFDLGEVFCAPFAMKLKKQRRGREPDVLFISKERAHFIKKNHLDGAADLVIEVVSPESVGRDRGEKFVEYEAAGIKEYWLVDHERESVEFYELGKDGRYRLAILADGVYRSKVIKGFFVRVAWLWQETLPTIEALRELKIM
ncbi:MAG: hypothetical protein NVSMB56_15100 [Pyrinomonadaceae bacterium]